MKIEKTNDETHENSVTSMFLLLFNLRERRSIEELDELSTERIENLRSSRRAAARLLKEQKAQEEGEA